MLNIEYRRLATAWQFGVRNGRCGWKIGLGGDWNTKRGEKMIQKWLQGSFSRLKRTEGGPSALLGVVTKQKQRAEIFPKTNI